LEVVNISTVQFPSNAILFPRHGYMTSRHLNATTNKSDTIIGRAQRFGAAKKYGNHFICGLQFALIVKRNEEGKQEKRKEFFKPKQRNGGERLGR